MANWRVFWPKTGAANASRARSVAISRRHRQQVGDADADLQLGGEEREITVMFADLSNFTTISDTMGPAELMELTNKYFQGHCRRD